MFSVQRDRARNRFPLSALDVKETFFLFACPSVCYVGFLCM